VCNTGYFLSARDRDCRVLSEFYNMIQDKVCEYTSHFNTKFQIDSTELCAAECDGDVMCEAFVHYPVTKQCALFNNTCTNNLLGGGTKIQNGTTLYTIKARACYCDDGSVSSTQGTCFVNGAEDCEFCNGGFNGLNHYCVGTEYYDTFQMYESTTCDFTLANPVFEIEPTPWDPLGVTLSVTECMNLCSNTPNCDTIMRVIDGSECKGYSYSDTCSSDSFELSPYVDLFRMYRNCSKGLNTTSGETVICKEFDPDGAECEHLHNASDLELQFLENCDSENTHGGDDGNGDDFNFTQIIQNMCGDSGYLSYNYSSEANNTCGAFSDSSRCPDDYCCFCGECQETCLPNVNVPGLNVTYEELRKDFAKAYSYVARLGGCYDVYYSDENTFVYKFGDTLNCSTSDEPEICNSLLNAGFDNLANYLALKDPEFFEKMESLSDTSTFDDANFTLSSAFLHSALDLYEYCNAFKENSQMAYSCNPITSSSLPPNVVFFDTSTNATWIETDSNGNTVPLLNVTDYITLPTCQENAVLSSLLLGSHCGLTCAEGFEPSDTPSAVVQPNSRRHLLSDLSPKGKSPEGFLICDMTSGDVHTDFTCKEKKCPEIFHEPFTGPTAFGGCEFRQVLSRGENCTVECVGDYQMIGTGVVTCESDATLNWGGTSCIPSCTPYTLPPGLEGFTDNPCYDGIVLNMNTDNFECNVKCKSGYHSNGQSYDSALVDCESECEGGDVCTSITSTLRQSPFLVCYERTCLDSDGMLFSISLSLLSLSHTHTQRTHSNIQVRVHPQYAIYTKTILKRTAMMVMMVMDTSVYVPLMLRVISYSTVPHPVQTCLVLLLTYLPTLIVWFHSAMMVKF